MPALRGWIGSPRPGTWRVGGLSKWVISRLIKGTLIGVMILTSDPPSRVRRIGPGMPKPQRELSPYWALVKDLS